MSTDTTVQNATAACEAIRALNHATITATVPAPLAYELLGDLIRVGFGLAQLANQLAGGLSRSLTEYDVYDENRDPAVSVAMADEALRQAAEHAWRVGECLAAAQIAINLQGYVVPVAHVHDEGDPR